MADRPKMVVFLDSFLGGGVQFSVLHILKQLQLLHNYDIIIVVRKKSGQVLKFVPASFEIIELGSSKGAIALWGLAIQFRKIKPQLIWSAIHCNNIVALAARKISFVQSPIMISEHSSIIEVMKTMGPFKRLLTKTLMKWLYPSASQIIAVSHGLAKELANELNIPRERIKVIYNAVNLQEIREKKKEQPTGHIDFSKPVFVAVGRLDLQKAYPTMLKAMAEMEHQAELLIIGEGPEKEKLQSLARRLGIDKRVLFLGYQDNPFQYMARARALVLSSIWEGFGRVIVEAMACGRPVISTSCPVGPDELVENEVTGFLVAVGDSQAMAKKNG